ncbi:MAG TPA: hypothetical protein VJP40_09065, partial [bacterium]|nr:hypothetical protein [bacterium]
INLSNEISSLDKEADPELQREGRLHLAARLESRYPAAAARLYAALVQGQGADAISEKAKGRLETLEGGGTFGAQAERLLRQVANDAFDPKIVLPMMAGSVAFTATRALAASRLASLSRPWAQGVGGRWLAAGLGFGVELPTFVLLQRPLASSQTSLSSDLLHAGFGLGLLKLTTSLMAAPLRRLPGQALLSHTVGGLGLFTVNRLEQRWGLRPESEPLAALAESFANYFSMAAGLRAGRSFLGQKFHAWEADLQWRSRNAPSRGSFDLSFDLALPEAVAASAYTPPGRAAPLLMSQSGGNGVGKGRSIPPAEAKKLSAEHRVLFTNSKIEPPIRWNVLEQYRLLHSQLAETKHFPDLQKTLLRLVANPGVSSRTLKGKVAEERAAYYGYQHRIRRTAAELYVQGVEQSGFADPMVERGAQILRKVLENPNIHRAHRPDRHDTVALDYYLQQESSSRAKLFPLYTKLLFRLPKGSLEARKGIEMLSRAPWLHRFENSDGPGEMASPAMVGRAYAYLLDAASPSQLAALRNSRAHLLQWLAFLETQARRGSAEDLIALSMAARHEKPAELALVNLEQNGSKLGSQVAKFRGNLEIRDRRRIEDQKNWIEPTVVERMLDRMKYYFREWFWFWH